MSLVAVIGAPAGAEVALADLGGEGNPGVVAFGGPMDGQPAQSPLPNMTYPPGAPAGSGQAAGASQSSSLVLAGIGLLALAVMAGAVLVVVRHRRRPGGAPT